MKNLFLISVIVVVLGILAVPVLAQEPVATATPGTVDQLPEFELPAEFPKTAQEGLAVVRAFITYVSALAAIYVTRGIRRLPVLTDGEKSKIAGLGADAVAGVMALAMGIVLTYGAIAAGWLDANGFWDVLKWASVVAPTTWVMHKAQKGARK